MDRTSLLFIYWEWYWFITHNEDVFNICLFVRKYEFVWDSYGEHQTLSWSWFKTTKLLILTKEYQIVVDSRSFVSVDLSVVQSVHHYWRQIIIQMFMNRWTTCIVKFLFYTNVQQMFTKCVNISAFNCFQAMELY